MNRPSRYIVAWIFAATWGCTPKRRPEPAPQMRVASQTVDSDAILWALGPASRAKVVAVSSLADDPRYSSVVNAWPPSVPRVAGTAEAMVALEPSVVFMAEWSDPHARKVVETAVASVVVLQGYGGFDDYRARVRTIARAIDAQPQGEALVEAFEARLAALQAPATEATVVSYASGTVAGSGTTFADEAAAAGLVNIPSREGIRGHKAVGMEQIVAWRPDLIVIPCEGPCARTETEFAAAPGMASTPAAARGGVVALPGATLFATGPRMLEVTQALIERRQASESPS